MYLDNSLILIFAKIFEVVDLALSLLLWAQYLSVTDSSAIRSSIWKIHQWIFFLIFQMAFTGGINCWGLTVEKKTVVFHCVKSVYIRSYSGPYFPAFGLNTEIYSNLFRNIRQRVQVFENDLKRVNKKYYKSTWPV